VTFPQAAADAMGMLGTLINAVALSEQLRSLGADARAVSAIPCGGVAELFSRTECVRHLEAGRIVVLGGGTGNPFFTTDTCASLRAAELGCDILLKATKVDGVYSADPKTDPKATRFDRLTFDEALQRNLKVMDLAALAMCQEQKMPVIVFDFHTTGNIAKAVKGGAIGTLITP
jgi:uridylate kinase